MSGIYCVKGKSLHGSDLAPTPSSAKGCFTDSTSTRTLVGYSTSTQTNTPQVCLNSCQSRGYAYGGVEYAQCYCSNKMVVTSSTGQPTAIGDCSKPCSGDSTQSCGNAGRIMIYTYAPPLPSGWSALGCYTDAPSFRALASVSTASSSNIPNSCISNCSSQGYSFAGVEFGKECYCGQSIVVSTSPSSGQLAPSGDCSMACSGSPVQTCGNGSRIFIYTTSSTTTTTTTMATTASATPTTTTTSTSSPGGKVVVAQ
ncbi:hypothetical protein BS47DRAFT_1304268 [Hydnum rufescens UP504]|uniref:WSC domain-containing protein n=1 Tax=Hydnum rufescens UP504 TaxID=1448309 RepID=A0A9P6AKX9_9AGAM|nr:hypothetical protein BS47DRAFT_1304268 [Hydnum rufescens UP504]